MRFSLACRFLPVDKAYRITYGFMGVIFMTTLTASQARAKLYKLMDEAAASHEPIQITGKRGNAVLVSEDDWRAIQETLYLLSVPGMRESIREGLKTPVEECSEELDW
jgi:prevent-host-death family protein